VIVKNLKKKRKKMKKESFDINGLE